jgi:hypothetical protein
MKATAWTLAFGALAMTAVACGETSTSPVDADELELRQGRCPTTLTDAKVDDLVAKASRSSDLATSFRCLSSAQQGRVLQDRRLRIDEVAVDFTARRAASLRARFERDVADEARGWWDTVLEGPYQLEGEAAIHNVDELRLSGKRIALRVVFGAPAVMTESCEAAADESWPEDCQRGTVSQTIYFDNDMDRIGSIEESATYDE